MKKNESQTENAVINTIPKIKPEFVKKEWKDTGKRRLTIKNEIGNRYEKLVVVGYKGLRKKDSNHIWKCRCDCGNITEVTTARLRFGQTKSCGCLRRRTGLNHPLFNGYQKITGKFWSNLRINARKRKMKLSISIRDGWRQFEKQGGKCIYSGRKLEFAHNEKDKGTASLDRINSDKDYTKNNVQWVHKDINNMKQCFSEEYFLQLVSEIYKNKCQ